MTSVVAICNLAIGGVRGQSINSIDQGTLSAQVCKLYYPICRDMLLEEVAWGFSRRIVALAVLSDEVHGWGYVYQYPNDCLVINQMIRNMPGIPYVPGEYFSPTGNRWPDSFSRHQIPKAEYQVMSILTNKVIVANEQVMRIDYRAAITNPTLFTNQFIGAVVALLKTYIAIPIAGAKDGVTLKREAEDEYQRLIIAASTNNANEQNRTVPESEYITVRG